MLPFQDYSSSVLLEMIPRDTILEEKFLEDLYPRIFYPRFFDPRGHQSEESNPRGPQSQEI